MSSDLKIHFEKYLEKENLTDKKLLLCVSGGVDSCVLLSVAQEVVSEKHLAVFHLDHNVRQESHNDFLFVQNLCSKDKIKFFGEVLEKKPSKTQKGLEAFWREKRKKVAQEFAQKFGAERILTAHHAGDFCETMIFRLTKGTGLSGLFPFDISTKPFWNISKAEIQSYADKHKLEWVEDASNQNTDFQRNLIRHNIIPELQKITPNLEKVMLREAEIFKNTQNFIESSLKDLVDFNLKKIALEDFQGLPIILKQEFLRKIAHKTPSFSEIEDGLKWLENEPKGGSQKNIGGTRMVLEKGVLRWE